MADVKIGTMNQEPNRLQISGRVSIPLDELEFSAVRAAGPGGQKVNKTSSAVQLRFDIRASSLPEFYKSRLLALGDSRIGRNGVLMIKAREFRSQEQNREQALARLQALVRRIAVIRKPRIATKPSRSAQRKRMDSKTRRGRIKALRRRVDD
jgi:ribosome-associated protein